MFDDLKRMIEAAQNLPNVIGIDLYDEFGGILRCMECGHETELTSKDVSHYLSKGWPKHCEYTMRWITKNERDATE